MPTTVAVNNLAPGYVGVSPDLTGKKIANYAVQMYVDNNDGLGPVIQTVYFQAVTLVQLDEYGQAIAADDRVDYEWKRQLLDEMRGIRLGMEHLLEMGRPSFDPALGSLVEEARHSRLPDEDTNLSQEV